MVENSPKFSMVVARDLMSLISGTEKVVFDAPGPAALWLDVNKPILAAVDERPQQHAADHAEDCGVGADAERERDHDRGGQALGAQERSQADPHVLRKRVGHVEPAAVPHAPHFLAQVRHVAELPQRREAGGLRILAAVDPFLDVDRQVAADFVVEVVLVGSHARVGHRYMSAV